MAQPRGVGLSALGSWRPGSERLQIPTTLNASALRDPDGRVIGAIGILRDMREYAQVVRDLEKSRSAKPRRSSRICARSDAWPPRAASVYH
jgi:hypothetical protein